MSTTIYNGLILRNATLERGFEILRDLRPTCVTAGRHATARTAARVYALEADLATNYSELVPGKDKGFWRLNQEFQQALVKVEGEDVRDTTWDATCHVYLLPSGPDLLAFYVIEKDAGYVQALHEAGFEDYQYQNATDRPEDISETEWDDREATWDRALNGAMNIAEAGLRYTLVDWQDLNRGLRDRDLVLANLPTREARRRRAAEWLTHLETHREDESLRVNELIERLREITKARADHVLLDETLASPQ